MNKNSGAMALTLVGGLLAAGLCSLLARLTAGFPPTLVESWLGSTPAFLHPFIEELANGFSPDLNPDDVPTAAFLTIQTLLWAVMVFTGWQILRRPDSPAVLLTILAFALLFRVLLLPSTPIHSAEASRYLWDGASTNHGINPYLYEPAALMMRERQIEQPTEIDGRIYRGRPWTEADGERLDRLAALREAKPDLHAGITDANLPSPHPPLAQVFFALATRLTNGSLTGFKSIVVLFDLGVIVLLLRLLRRLRLRRGGVIFYAWSPVVLLSFANAGHWEAVPLFFFLWALTLAVRRKTWSGTVVLAMACLGRTANLLQGPALFRPTRRHLAAWLLLGVLTAGAFLPFILWQGAGGAPVLNGLRWTESSAPALPGIFLALQRLSASFVSLPERSGFAALVGCGLLFLTIFLRKVSQPDSDPGSLPRKAFAIAATLFLLSPHASPWQLVWIIPFLCAFPQPSWLVLMLTLQAGFLQFHTDYADFSLTAAPVPWLHLTVWASFCGLAFLDPLLLRLLERPSSVSGQDPTAVPPS
ncbi:MAG: hypothetical protein KGS60_02895 [Verrucomicrobia bacterium]|nr:hypothetical protein [Verrucomicrobiota bacterium]